MKFDFLLATDMTMGIGVPLTLALLYRDTGMAEIGTAYFPRVSFSPGRLPLGTREELNDVCVILERSSIIYIV